MKKCKACKSEIDPKATKCPKCGADQRIWFAKHPILTVILVLIVLGIFGSAANGGKSGSTASTQTVTDNQNKAKTQPAQQTAMVVDAKLLVGEFDKNKLSAQDNYTGKLVKTTAYINNISSDVLGSYFLSLNPSNDKYYFGTSIQCYFADKSSLTSLEKGQQITVQGTMQDMSLGIVKMKDCQIVK